MYISFHIGIHAYIHIYTYTYISHISQRTLIFNNESNTPEKGKGII